MNTVWFAIFLGFLGLFFGSFAGATVWRLRAKQLLEDEVVGEKVPAKEKKLISKLQNVSLLKDRSICLHCGHQLAWYDLLPLASWLYLRGKCRYCHKHIGNLEPLVEIGVAAFFVVSFLFWPAALSTPFEVARFVLWLVGGVGLAILTVYDLKWFLLPNRVMFPLMGVGLLYSLLVLSDNNFTAQAFFSIALACAVLSGIYYLIYLGSKQQWVGFGDVKLGLVLALLLADWKLAILALFLANAIGTLVIVPLMLSGKVKRHARIPFGPLLISGWLIAGLFGGDILRWYLSLAIGV
jgi:leader peptidase (prepilin peptidase) / N-methyltransferase